MEFAIDAWIEEYLKRLKELFGGRLVFVGLQGSYGRGEATDDSDIDAVVLLDRAAPEDLKAYGAMLDALPNRAKACGFISGRRELISWEPSDLFQLYHDTTPILGSLDFLLPRIGREDVRRAIRIGACNIYHLCGHNLVHGRSARALKGLYKSAAFALQAVYFDRTGTYVRRKAALMPLVEPAEREILRAGVELRRADPEEADFDRLSALLFNWAAGVIAAYGAGPAA